MGTRFRTEGMKIGLILVVGDGSTPLTTAELQQQQKFLKSKILFDHYLRGQGERMMTKQ
jgi:hypothetical protein